MNTILEGNACVNKEHLVKVDRPEHLQYIDKEGGDYQQADNIKLHVFLKLLE